MMSTFTTFVGTSAGALLALMLVLGLRSDDMLRFIKDKFIKRKCHELDVDQVIDFAETWGLDNGSRIMAMVSDMISTVTGESDMTFIQLAKHTGKNLVVCVSNVSIGTHEFMSLESTPDMSVLTALRMSMSVPVVFTPVHANGMIYVDGGMFDNFPIDHCVNPNLSSSSSSSIETLGLDISFNNNVDFMGCSPPAKLSSITEYFVTMMYSMISRSNVTTREFYKRCLASKEYAKCCHGAKAMTCDSAFVIQFANDNGPGNMFNFSVGDMCFDMSDKYLLDSIAIGYAVMKDAMRVIVPNLSQ